MRLTTECTLLIHTFFLKPIVPEVVWLIYTCMQSVRLTITWCVYFLYACMHIYIHTCTYRICIHTHWVYTVYIHIQLYKSSSQILIPNAWNFSSLLNTDNFQSLFCLRLWGVYVSALVMWNFIYGWVNKETLHSVSAWRQSIKKN